MSQQATEVSGSRRSGRRHRKLAAIGHRGTAVLALFGVIGFAAVSAPLADPAEAHSKKDSIQTSLDALVRADVAPGALASVRDRNGRVTNYTAGTNDLRRARIPTDGYVRMASNTKMYTAVAVLQLVDEGTVSLDEPIETYLPGLLRGDGYDGRNITVRQILNMTSGLATYDFPHVSEWGDTYFEPRELLDKGLAKEPVDLAPGEVDYSNTNYILAGLLVQRVTGRPISEVIANKILKPAGLRKTYWPGVGDKTIRKPHAKGYLYDVEAERWSNITELDPSIAWAAGQMIATPSDLNRFLVALQNGELLTPESLAEMRESNTFLPGGEDLPDLVWEYGLGTTGFNLSCGGVAWGHGGDIDGYSSRSAITADGRAVTIVVTADEGPAGLDGILQVLDAFDAALCASR